MKACISIKLLSAILISSIVACKPLHRQEDNSAQFLPTRTIKDIIQKLVELRPGQIVELGEKISKYASKLDEDGYEDYYIYNHYAIETAQSFTDKQIEVITNLDELQLEQVRKALREIYDFKSHDAGGFKRWKTLIDLPAEEQNEFLRD